jgi:hypothetical protein
MKKITLAVMFVALFLCVSTSTFGFNFVPSSGSRSLTSPSAPTSSFYNSITLPYSVDSLVFDVNSAPTMTVLPSESYPAIGFKVTLASSASLILNASSREIPITQFAFEVSQDPALSSNNYMNVGNGTTSILSAGSYYIVLFSDNLYGKFDISITSSIATAVINVNNDDLRVFSDEGAIMISGVTANSNISVFTIDGRLVTSKIADSNTYRVEVPTAGLYLVKINGICKKVLVK